MVVGNDSDGQVSITSTGSGDDYQPPIDTLDLISGTDDLQVADESVDVTGVTFPQGGDSPSESNPLTVWFNELRRIQITDPQFGVDNIRAAIQQRRSGSSSEDAGNVDDSSSDGMSMKAVVAAAIVAVAVLVGVAGD